MQPPSEHENGLTENDAGGGPDPLAGQRGQVRPRTAGLLAAGFAIGAVTIGTMSLTLGPDPPSPVEPIRLGGPDERERSRDGSRGGKRDEGARGRGAGQDERPARRRRGPAQRSGAAPAPPAADGQPSAPAPPPAATPRPAPLAPTPSPRPRPQPQAPQPQPAPAPLPPPPADDDDDDDGDGDDLGGDD